MRRRRLLTGLWGGVAALLCTAHTPYQQWVIYRKRHLIILTSKADASAYDLGQRVAAVLARELPASKARVTRAPYMERIGSLLSTAQLDVALLKAENASALLHGRPPFVDYGPLPLRRIAALGAYVLVCRDDFPARHAYLMAQALDGHAADLVVGMAAEAVRDVPMHAGALAYARGQPLPAYVAPEH